MLTSKRVEGEVEYNDGEFAEVLTIGIEGIEQDLLLDTIQIHRCDTQDTPEDFKRRFPVGTRLSIVTSIDVTIVRQKCGEKRRRVRWTSGTATSSDLRGASQ